MLIRPETPFPDRKPATSPPPPCLTVRRSDQSSQAILEDSSDRELALNIKAHRDVLRLFAKDAPGQIAQLIALENFLGVTNPGQIKSVGFFCLPFVAFFGRAAQASGSRRLTVCL